MTKRNFKILAFFSLFLLPFPSWSQEQRTLAIGEQASLPLAIGSRFSVGNAEVLGARATHSAKGAPLLLLKGKSQGYSDILIVMPDGSQRQHSYRIVTKKQASLKGDGGALLPPSSSVKLMPVGEGWVARGELKSIDDWNSLRLLQEQGKGKVQNLSRIHPLTRLQAEAKITSLFRAAGLSHLKVRGAGSLILLQGVCRNQEQKALAEELAGQVFKGARSQLVVPFDWSTRLRFRAKIFELLKSGAKEMGVDWDTSAAGSFRLAKNFTGADFGLSAALRLMEKRGFAKVLAEPQLMLNEKGVAELKVGGEFPVKTTSRNSSSVSWKPYGLLLRLELPGVAGDLARSKIIVEMSNLDPSNAVDGIPALRLSRMETMVDLSLGKPALLSGLSDQRESHGVKGLPGLGDIPILGELFRSHDFQENRSELAILIEAEESL